MRMWKSGPEARKVCDPPVRTRGMMPFLDEDRPDWEREGRDWPNRAASRFVKTPSLRWHVQEFGDPGAPGLLLLHGTGAATHSWRDLAPLLAADFRVLAPDLPGHGFTDPLAGRRLSLPGMAGAVADLVAALGFEARVVAGHSAGAAVLARMCLDGAIAPDLLLALNGALKPFHGLASLLFPGLARMLFLNPLMPRVFAWSADGAAVQRLIDGTGSRIDERGLACYRQLLARPGHVAGALGMMANWDLGALEHDLARLALPVILLVGSRDRTIRPDSAHYARKRMPNARIVTLKGLGHLAHEEAPEAVAALVRDEARAAGALPPVTPKRAPSRRKPLPGGESPP